MMCPIASAKFGNSSNSTARSTSGSTGAPRSGRGFVSEAYALVTLSPELSLEAARAANRAGDPELGAQLAERVDGLPGARLLAQAHAMRNRYEDAEAALAQAEPLAAGHPEAADYLKQRLWLLHWGLRRAGERFAG